MQPTPFRLLVCFVAASACVPRGLVEDARDRDDDGYVAWQLGGDDCDDAEPTANPGEGELCGDLIDNDCDRVIDDDGSNAATWYPDLDGDGFAIDAPVTACVQPANHRASLDAGVDCDDADATIHPGAADAWYDGIDSNCDAADDFDQDADGHRAPSGGGLDCDDLNDNVHPGALEICGNRIDDDCDGTHNTCALSGTLAMTATRNATLVWAFETATQVRISAGDTNLDGRDDVLMSGMGSGEIFLFEGPLTGTLLTSLHADVQLTLPEPPNIFGYGTSLHNDLDGDSAKEIFIANAEQNDWPVVHVAMPPFRSTMSTTDLTKTFDGPDPAITPNSGFGFLSGSLGDLDADGVDHFFVSQGGTTPPVCYILEGMGAGTYLPNIATATITNCTAGLVGAPDLDGNGVGDVATTGTDAIAYLSGVPTGTIDLATATLLSAWSGGDRVAPSAMRPASLDGDVHHDLVVSVFPPSVQTVSVEVLFGPLDEVNADSPRLRVDPEDGDDVYIAIPPVDMNGDGHLDVVLLHIARDLVAGTADLEVHIFNGPLGDAIVGPADASARIVLDLPLSLFLNYDSGDFDGDGFGDVIIGGLGVAEIIYGQGR